jgi:hypothetical protein
MARSSRIYVVISYFLAKFSDETIEPKIEATFTVKHEAKTWLERNVRSELQSLYQIHNWPDGGSNQDSVKVFTYDEFMKS